MNDASINILSKKIKKKKSLTILNRRIALSFDLYRLINHTKCCRKIELEFFDEIQLISEKCESFILNDCCSRCSSTLECTKKLIASIKVSSKWFKRSSAEKIEKRHRVSVKIQLTKWRTHKASEIFFIFMTVMCFEIYVTFLFFRMIKTIAQNCMFLKNVDDLKNIVHDWKWFDDYVEKFWNCVQNVRNNAKIFDFQQKNQTKSSIQSSFVIEKFAKSAKSTKLSLQSNDQLIKQSFNDTSLFISSFSIRFLVKKKIKTLKNFRSSSIKFFVKRKIKIFKSFERSSIKFFVKKKIKTFRSFQLLINYNKIKFSFQKDEKQNAISKNEMFRKKFNFNASNDKVRIMRKTVFEHFIRFEKLASDLLFDKKKKSS